MCEGFDQTHDIRVDQSSTSTLSSMAEDGQTVLRHILEAPMDAQMASGDNAEADKQNFEKLQGAYRACMNETAIKARGIEPVVYLVRELLEHADVSNSEVATSSSRTSRKFDLPRALSFLMSIGVAPLIELGIEVGRCIDTIVRSSLTCCRPMRRTRTLTCFILYHPELSVFLPRNTIRIHAW